MPENRRHGAEENELANDRPASGRSPGRKAEEVDVIVGIPHVSAAAWRDYALHDANLGLVFDTVGGIEGRQLLACGRLEW